MLTPFLLAVCPDGHALLTPPPPLGSLVVATDFGRSSHCLNPGAVRDWCLGSPPEPAGDKALVLVYAGKPVVSSWDHLLRTVGRVPLRAYDFDTTKSARHFAAYFLPAGVALESA